MSTKTKAKPVTLRLISKKVFDRMTPAKQRVALAKDVLARLAAGKIKEKKGTYLLPVSKKLNDLFHERVSESSYLLSDKAEAFQKSDAKTFVTENKCEVCAKGSIILAWAANFNEVKMKDVFNAESLRQLDDTFPSDMWDAMETAFEQARWTLSQVMGWLIQHKGNFPFDGTIYSDDMDWDEHPKSVAPYRYPRSKK